MQSIMNTNTGEGGLHSAGWEGEPRMKRKLRSLLAPAAVRRQAVAGEAPTGWKIGGVVPGGDVRD